MSFLCPTFAASVTKLLPYVRIFIAYAMIVSKAVPVLLVRPVKPALKFKLVSPDRQEK